MVRSLANIAALGVKELRSLRADPVLLLLILYTFTFAVYSVATNARLEVENAAIAVVDEDHSTLANRIVEAIQAPIFRPPVLIAASSIDRVMNEGRFLFVLEIPPRFEADLLADRHPSVQVNVDATAISQAGVGAVYLQNIISRTVLGFVERAEADAYSPVKFVVRALFNPNLKSEWFTSVMQVINNITILSVILAGAALIREREQGTIEHLLVMPVTPTEIMLAKIWANGLVIVVAALLSLLVVVRILLDVPIEGSIGLFIAGTLLYQFSVTALGILHATFAKSMAQFGLLALPILIVMILLSGSTTPMESMPDWLGAIMQVSPTAHFVRFAQAVLYRGAGFAIVWAQLVTVALISAGIFAVALARFRVTLAAAR